MAVELKCAVVSRLFAAFATICFRAKLIAHQQKSSARKAEKMATKTLRRKKLSYSELESELAHTKRDYALERWSLLLTLEGEPDFVVSAEDERGSYEFRLYGSALSFGGLVVRIFRYPGNDCDQVETLYLQDLRNSAMFSWSAQEAIRKVHEAHRRIVAKLDHSKRVERHIPRLPDTEVS